MTRNHKDALFNLFLVACFAAVPILVLGWVVVGIHFILKFW